MKTVLFHIDDATRAKFILARVRSRLRPASVDRLYPDAKGEHECKEFFASFNDAVNVEAAAHVLSNLPGISQVEIPAQRGLLAR